MMFLLACRVRASGFEVPRHRIEIMTRIAL